MKFREIFRFELAYQARRIWPWLYFLVLTVVAVLFVRGNFMADALFNEFYLNAPFIIASATVIVGLLWFILAGAVAGEAGARDAETGMHPLIYTAPIPKLTYLGARFLAAFTINALILLALPIGVLIAVYAPDVDPEVVGPFRPAAFLTAYGFISLPNAFIGTAIQFAWATLGRRSIASYFGSVVFFFVVYATIFSADYFAGNDWAMLFDAFGHIFITSDLVLGWTPIEKNTRLIELEGSFLWSRIIWLSIALGTLAFTYFRFQFVHPTETAWWSRILRRRAVDAPAHAEGDLTRLPISIPVAHQTFDLATYARQTLAITWDSFWTIAKGRGGLATVAVVSFILVMVLPRNMVNLGTPFLPRTAHILTLLTTALTNVFTPWVLIPLLIVFYSGELVWKERGAGLGEISDAAPVPDWVRFLGKFLGLNLILVVWMAGLTLAGLLVQARMGYGNHEIGLFLRVLFGLQLPEYILFALLALVIQGLVSQKQVGHLFALLAFVLIAFASTLRINHHLLVYGSGPGWTYSDIRGFGPSVGPWLWFKLYWAAWALLLAVAARLLWVRGLEGGIGVRLRLAPGRFTRATASVAALAIGLILTVGGFIFYNTNVLNDYSTNAEGAERSAEYERLYSRYEDVPQPALTGVNLQVELYPDRRSLQIRGSYRLVNRGAVAIDSVHLATATGVRNDAFAFEFDRAASAVVTDVGRGHRIYALAEPLQPGDSLHLAFEVHFEPRGFRNSGASAAVVENGTYFTNRNVLPAIGYQSSREIIPPAQRRKLGLPERPLLPSLDDVEALGGWPSSERIDFEAVVGTDEGQTAIAPGVLQRTWTEGGRSYFHYATEAPIGNEYAFFSANYAVRESVWTPAAGQGHPVTIQIFHHAEHTANVDRMLRSVEGSLTYDSKQFGPYPYSYIRLIENTARGMGAHAEATTIDYGEGFSLFNPDIDPRGIDLPFAIVAHEMGHQWNPALVPVVGAGLLSESHAWYSALGVVEAEYGLEHLQRLMRFFRQPYPILPIRQSMPLLEAMDPYAAYRKGPFALYALRFYAGEEAVNGAFRHLLAEQRAGRFGPATSRDLYRELQVATPDSLQYLLRDLLAANTFWDLQTPRATAAQTAEGTWDVTLQVRARKVTVDPAGIEKEVPMDEWVQIGVFAPTDEGEDFGDTLYLQMHRIRSGDQTITVTVPQEPSDAGVDPYILLIDTERFDNVEEVEIEG